MMALEKANAETNAALPKSAVLYLSMLSSTLCVSIGHGVYRCGASPGRLGACCALLLRGSMCVVCSAYSKQ